MTLGVSTDQLSSIEALFQQYLQSVVETSSTTARLEYLPATVQDTEPKTFVADIKSSDSSQDKVILKPTTPLLYSYLALSLDNAEFICHELDEPDPLKSILYTNDAPLIRSLFSASQERQQRLDNTSLISGKFSPVPLGWLPIFVLRGCGLSSLDDFAMQYPDLAKQKRYREATVKLLVSKYLFLGIPEVLDMILFLIKTWLLWTCARTLIDCLSTEPSQWASKGARLVLRLTIAHVFWLTGQVL